MTWDEFKQLTMPLAVQLGAEWDAPTWKLYHRAVEKMPVALYAAALQTVAETWRTKSFPPAGKVREFAEDARQGLLKANPHEPCATCEDTPGWAPVLVNGVSRLTRCACWHSWRQRLDQLGLNGGPLALPALPPAEGSEVA